MIYLELLIGFLKVGCFGFGSAYGSIPIIRDIALSYGWLTDEGLSYIIAVSESTPGPILVNLATFVGNTQAGILGAVVATFAVCLPAFIIIIVITRLLNTIIENSYVQAVIEGIKACIIGIIIATGAYMIVNNCLNLSGSFKADIKGIILTVVLGAVMLIYKPVFKKKLSPIVFIIIAAVCGIILYSIF